MADAADRSSYRLWTQDKLRYNDTDRQGHVNNAVYATLFETGRVGFVEVAREQVAGVGSEFVVARVVIDFRAELHYPGTIARAFAASGAARSCSPTPSSRMGAALRPARACWCSSTPRRGARRRSPRRCSPGSSPSSARRRNQVVVAIRSRMRG
jgi:hypothetical protein